MVRIVRELQRSRATDRDVGNGRRRREALHERRRAERRAPRLGRLLPRVGVLQQLRFFPRAAEQFERDRQSIGAETGRHRDRRQSRRRAQLAVGAALRFANQRRLAAQRRVGERIDAQLFERGQHRGAQRAALDHRLAIVLGLALLRLVAQAERRVELGVIQAAIENLAERLHRRVRDASPDTPRDRT